MYEQHEAEIRLALGEGVIARSEAEALLAEARRLRRSPLDLLVERGRVSEQSRAELHDELARQQTAPAPTGIAGDATMDIGAEQPPMPASTGFPWGWTRYDHVRLLGEGGMGRVFLAYDPRLRRNVAIKFMRDQTPGLVHRFLAEARAQASVDHPHVCKVYEVGEIEGRAYLAIQYVAGDSLDALVDRLSIEQKALLMRDVAEGVHAAHRVGLIHRDLKPSNILAERTPEGRLVPYVMDFGLARDWKEGTTMTGAVVGTPGFMAPEQARGEVKNLDRRADVYGLGATMYHLLTGERPIPGKNVIEVLRNVELVEPRPLRALDPDIPVDLEAIVLQCLEKDRAARYGSARALAEDLDRFLRGDPVLARRAGRLYRLRKQAYKHRRLLSAATAAFLIVALALGWAALTRRQTAERERLAQRFTEQVERVEARARYASLAPLHDTRPDRAALEAQMDALAAEVRRAGDLARGPGYYALGRGHLALGDVEAAREDLERAWRQGYREPRVAYALALVMGHMYQDGLTEIARLRAAERREAERAAIEQRYRAPALAYLRLSEGADVPAAEYMSALLAYYEGRMDEALARLDAVKDRLPWFYEAPKLQGDIHAAQAGAAWHRGDRAAAQTALERGRQAYEAAAGIGRSDPEPYLARAELEYAALSMELYGKGNVEPHTEAGIAAVTQALAAAPAHYDAQVLAARFHRRVAEHRMATQGAAGPSFAAALAFARSAQDTAPGRPEARLELGRIWMHTAQHAELEGRDPRPSIQRGAEAFESVASAARDPEYYLDLAAFFTIWANHEAKRGGDSLTPRDRTIDACRKAIELDPRPAGPWLTLGNAYLQRADHSRATDPEGDLKRAMEMLEQGLQRNPEHIASYFYAAQAHELMAGRLRNRGQDPAPHLAQAIALHRAGIAINDQIMHFHNGLGMALLAQAQAAWDHGQEPWPLLDQAQAAFERAMAVASAQPFGYNNVGETHVRRARYQHALGLDVEASARAAGAAYEQAMARMPGDALFAMNLALVSELLAARELEHGRDPGAFITRGTRDVDAALSRNPELASGWRQRAELPGAAHPVAGPAGDDARAAARAGGACVRARHRTGPGRAGAPGGPGALLPLVGVLVSDHGAGHRAVARAWPGAAGRSAGHLAGARRGAGAACGHAAPARRAGRTR